MRNSSNSLIICLMEVANLYNPTPIMLRVLIFCNFNEYEKKVKNDCVLYNLIGTDLGVINLIHNLTHLRKSIPPSW